MHISYDNYDNRVQPISNTVLLFTVPWLLPYIVSLMPQACSGKAWLSHNTWSEIICFWSQRKGVDKIPSWRVKTYTSTSMRWVQMEGLLPFSFPVSLFVVSFPLAFSLNKRWIQHFLSCWIVIRIQCQERCASCSRLIQVIICFPSVVMMPWGSYPPPGKVACSFT